MGVLLKCLRASIEGNNNITLESAIEIINIPITTTTNVIHKFNDNITILKGKYGPYISYNNKKNIKITGNKAPEDLTLNDCIIMINKAKSKKKYNNNNNG